MNLFVVKNMIIGKIDLIQVKIKYANNDLKINQDYIIKLNQCYDNKINNYNFKDNSILKVIRNTKQLVRYYQKRIISLTKDLEIYTDKLNKIEVKN